MRAVMVMFDSLNRHMLPPYGCDWTHAPNFRRLAERTVTFDNSYICSMPCMPARRDLHTGRPNFLHRAWGPLEPFDDSVPRLLRDSGISSHLVSDHYHYWETGGATYHTQYSTWQFFRGQEGDPWVGQAAPAPPGPAAGQNASESGWHRQDRVNRGFMRREQDQPQSQTFAAGIDFMRRNRGEDDWFLQIETFDPHEPFFTQRHYQDLYPDLIRDRSAPLFDWPKYGPVTESRELVDQCRGRYAALLSMCDARLGDVLDEMDRLEMWEDTMLVVWTDHGFLLGERDLWAKGQMPWYREHANTPFFVWDPRCGKERRAPQHRWCSRPSTWGRPCSTCSASSPPPTCSGGRLPMSSTATDRCGRPPSSGFTAGTSTSPTAASCTCARPPPMTTARSSTTP